MKHGRSLVAAVTWIVALVTGAAMLVHVLFEYLMNPALPVWRLLSEETWHVVALGGLTCAALYYLLRKKVADPIRQLYVKLYAIARGDSKPMTIHTNIREIRDIVEGVNLMLSQQQLTAHDPWGSKLRSGAEALRSLAGRTSPNLEAADRENLSSLAAEMEELAGVFERLETTSRNLRRELLHQQP